jgi:ComF family protein
VACISCGKADIESCLRTLLPATLQYRNGPGHCQLAMLHQVYEPLIGLLLPELCQRCGSAAAAGFCHGCRGEFEPNLRPCPVCGCGPLPAGRNCCPSHAAEWILAHVAAPLVYAAPLEGYLHALKYAGRRALGRGLGQILAAAAGPRRTEVDALVSVPLHPRRLAERGYNQAFEIARAVSAELRLPILRAGIVRTRDTAPQARSDCELRHANLTGAFTVTRGLHGRRLAVVDDVITTGATVNSLARALYGAGAAHVEAWAVARTRPPQAAGS